MTNSPARDSERAAAAGPVCCVGSPLKDGQHETDDHPHDFISPCGQKLANASKAGKVLTLWDAVF